MDYCNKLIKKSFLFGLSFCFLGCFLKKDKPKVDSFYLTRQFNSLPKLPLIKPLTAGKDYDNIWGMSTFYIDEAPSMSNIKSLGIEGDYVYGKHNSEKITFKEYTKDMYVFAFKSGGFTWRKNNKKPDSDETRIYPIDSVSKQFILPEIWVAMHLPDSTSKAFFSESKYKAYLKKKGISGKMYNLDTMYAVLCQTDTLPWFPKEVKDKIIQHKNK